MSTTHDPNRRGTWYQGTRILHMPDLVSTPPHGRGRAWRVNWTTARAVQSHPDATVASWLVHAPGAHPFWDHYVFSIIHLRKTEGLPAPNLAYPDATHEMMIVALDPGESLPDPKTMITMHYLRPVDFHEQCKLRNDADADKLLEVLVTLAVDNILSPDTDYRDAWTAAFWKTAHRLCHEDAEQLH